MKFRFITFFCLSLLISSFLDAKGVEDATGYNKNSNLQYAGAIDILKTLPWSGIERVLDVGCGDGKITALIAKNFSQGTVVGLDISESMIHFASTQFSHENFPNLFFLTGSADKLPFEGQFDRVVSFSTLHWVLDQEKALKDIHKSLVHGGKAYLLTYGKAPMNLSTLSENIMRTEKWAPFFLNYVPQRVYFTEEEYHHLLQKAGFSNFELTSHWSETHYANRLALIGFIKPLLNFIQHLSLSQQEEFVGEVADKIIELNPCKECPIAFKVLKLQVVATK